MNTSRQNVVGRWIHFGDNIHIVWRLHQSLCKWRTSTLRRIATARGGFIQAILSNGDVHDAAAYRAPLVRAGSGGIEAFTVSRPDRIRAVTPYRCAGYAIKEKGRRPPGRLSVPFAATKGTPNCTNQHGYMRNSVQYGAVTRQLPPGGSSCSPPAYAKIPPPSDSLAGGRGDFFTFPAPDGPCTASTPIRQ